eukprot:3032346-Ditylum_brightwellii.AAC.1
MGTTSVWIRRSAVSRQNILVVNMVGLDKWRTGACQQKRYPTRGYNTLWPQPQQKHTEKKKS